MGWPVREDCHEKSDRVGWRGSTQIRGGHPDRLGAGKIKDGSEHLSGRLKGVVDSPRRSERTGVEGMRSLTDVEISSSR